VEFFLLAYKVDKNSAEFVTTTFTKTKSVAASFANIRMHLFQNQLYSTKYSPPLLQPRLNFAKTIANLQK
jgi:hypothetical protein